MRSWPLEIVKFYFMYPEIVILTSMQIIIIFFYYWSKWNSAIKQRKQRIICISRCHWSNPIFIPIAVIYSVARNSRKHTLHIIELQLFATVFNLEHRMYICILVIFICARMPQFPSEVWNTATLWIFPKNEFPQTRVIWIESYNIKNFWLTFIYYLFMLIIWRS